MTSTNTARLTYAWDAWVSMPGQGRAFAHGTVTVPASYCWTHVQREVGAWLGAQGATGRLADIHLQLTPQA
ncbi:hypothetical protein [Streptomyces sp. 142MFCol3.1]|uniref:hypothetical protein n=1 Tax=Streptomyces sp. 142MFCol3.1 TaxID=1172179 RepID=UPI0003FC24CA|nr:hypothetical protein [Streptomyces sp. 142MFCol3.1]